MSRWWRAEDTSIDHPKLLGLSDALHRAWYTLMCVASANGGTLPPASEIAIRLRMKPTKVAEWIAALVKARLFDNIDGTFVPHNWGKRQYKIDATDNNNAERQRKFRAKQRLELAEMKALRDNGHMALRNGVSNALRSNVTNVTAKRPDTETDNITTSLSEDTGLPNAEAPKRPDELTRTELEETFARRRFAQ